jgi:predicted nucleic acid-binding Zn ribbon protein
MNAASPSTGSGNDSSPSTGSGNDTTLSSSVYLRFKSVFGDASSRRYGTRKRRVREPVAESEAFGRGRDPKGIADVMSAMTSELGWATPLAKSDLLLAWTEIAGADTAEHSFPLDVTDSVLTVQCDSTAWATQLRHMRTMIMTRIAQSFPDAGIESVRFQAPHAPSWKKGSRSIPGRGPRDTYG